MPKKAKLNLTYSNGNLWWSADGKINWAIVGPNSPVTILDAGADIEWAADDTLDISEITPHNTEIMDAPTGTKKDKKAKIKDKAKLGDKCKYDITIVINSTGETITFDPDIQFCQPVPPTGCPPTGGS